MVVWKVSLKCCVVNHFDQVPVFIVEMKKKDRSPQRDVKIQVLEKEASSFFLQLVLTLLLSRLMAAAT